MKIFDIANKFSYHLNLHKNCQKVEKLKAFAHLNLPLHKNIHRDL